MAQQRTFFFFFFFFLLVASVVSVQGAGAGVGLVPPIGKRYIFGGADGWRVPPRENKDMYLKWASTIQFFVEDSIEFMYKNDSVGKVNKYAYYHCNWTALDSTPPAKDGSSLFLLDAPGFAYFASADIKHCKKGQRRHQALQEGPAPHAQRQGQARAPPSPAPPATSPGPVAPGEPVMDSGAGAPTSSRGRALVLVVSATTLALMGMIRA